jgi:hypothetical protein
MSTLGGLPLLSFIRTRFEQVSVGTIHRQVATRVNAAALLQAESAAGK